MELVQGNQLLHYFEDKCYNCISYNILEQTEEKKISRLIRLIKFSFFFEAIPPFKGTYPRLSTICIRDNGSTSLQ